MSRVEPNCRTTLSTKNTTKLHIQQEIHLKKNTIIKYRHSQKKSNRTTWLHMEYEKNIYKIINKTGKNWIIKTIVNYAKVYLKPKQ